MTTEIYSENVLDLGEDEDTEMQDEEPAKPKNSVFDEVAQESAPKVLGLEALKLKMQARKARFEKDTMENSENSAKNDAENKDSIKKSDDMSEDGEIIEEEKSRKYESNLPKCLGVFGLATITTQKDLEMHFRKYGAIRKINLITDPKTCISKGFAFIYFEEHESAVLGVWGGLKFSGFSG